jgi:hypothetical protein
MATAVIYDGVAGFDNVGETAKNVIKGGAIGAATGLATIFVTNKIPVINRMNPIIKSVIELGIVIGITALAKDKLGEETATAMGVGGASVVLGAAISKLLAKKFHSAPQVVPGKHGFEGYGDAVAPIIEEVDGYGDAVAPVVEEVDGYGNEGELEEEPVEVDVVDGYGEVEDEDEGVVVTVE